MRVGSKDGDSAVQPRVSAVDDNFVIATERAGTARVHARASDWKAVDELLTLLARAVQQLHTYPATSPLCTTAIESCQRALASLDHRDQLTFRVTPSELLVDDIPTGRGAPVGHELARRLHKASVSEVTLERAASSREIGRFCEDLVRCADRVAGETTLMEMLTEHGVERVAVKLSSRPEVLELTAVPPTAAADLMRERARFNAQLARGGLVQHLYPPQKGWVRLDPGSAPPAVSLLDLAVLADDPAALATMLLRLTDEAADVPAAEALERKYTDVTMLLSALDPRVARRMFAKLARAVLDLEPQSRQALLRRTVLPGLLDGRVDAAILHDFPDVDLAESLCLLLDLETAAPELLTTALSRLDLSPERHASMVPLLESRLKERERGDSPDASGRQSTLARHARELVRVEAAAGKSFADFAAFDLALDETAAGTLAQIREAVPRTDNTGSQLTCLWHLVCLEPNPEAVSGFLARSFSLLDELERDSRGAELPHWLGAFRQLAERLWDTRPDVSAVIGAHLATFCTVARAAWIADLSLCEPGGRQAAGAVITALGPAIAPPLVELLEREPAERGAAARGARGRGRAVTQLLNDHPAELAPALAPLLERSSPAVRRTLLRVLGAAGAGYETFIGVYVGGSDEGTAREALRALARLGTSKAAGLVVAEIERQRGALSVAAEETLWHFPLREAQRQTRELLGRREFTMNHPHATERLLDRAARAGSPDLTPVLLGLAPMRFRVWNPALARVARKANAMLKAPLKAELQP